MEKIKDTIETVIQNITNKKGSEDAAHPGTAIKKLLTKRELEHIKVSNFYKGVLYINVDSSSWLYALSLRRKVFLEELKDHSDTIKDIRFRLGEID